jgi:hypothetical protein
MRRKTEKVTFENKWGEGKQEGKKSCCIFLLTRKMINQDLIQQSNMMEKWRGSEKVYM